MGIITKKRIIWLVILIGLALRVISLDQSLWLDEAINVIATQNYNFWGMVTEYAKADFHPPLYFMLLWVWTKLFGISEIAVRIPSVVLGIATIFIVYKIGSKLVSDNVGFIAATLLAVNPLHIYYSQEARMYSLATFAVTLNFFLFTKFFKKEKVNNFYFISSTVLVFLSDYLAYFIFPAQFVFLLLNKQTELIKIWVRNLLISILVIGFWIPIFFQQLSVGLDTTRNVSVWSQVVGSTNFKVVILTYVKFIIGRISLDDKFIYALVFLPIGILFLLPLINLIKSKINSTKFLLLSWIFIPIILSFIISFIIPVYSYFRLLFVLPPFLILISLGVDSFSKKVKTPYLTVLILIGIICSTIYLFNPKFQREDWKGAVNFLKRNEGIVLFESSGTFAPFDYYARGLLPIFASLKNFPAINVEDLNNFESITSKNVYLLDYLVDISDPNRLVAKRLIELGYNLSQIHNFNSIGFIYHFRK